MSAQTVTIKLAIDSSQLDAAVERIQTQIDEIADLAETRLRRLTTEFEREYEKVDQILGKDKG